MARQVEIAEAREAFNASFTRARYERFLHDLNTRLPYPTDFRVSETPLFLSAAFASELAGAAEEVIRLLRTPDFRRHAARAVPPGLAAPHEDAHPQLLQLDFAITAGDTGTYTPRLIELQGFPSLYGYQHYFDGVLRDHFEVPSGLSSRFGGLSAEGYIARLREVILDDADPEETILLEIDPARQKTRIDFAATERLLPVRAVCVRDVRKRGRELWYDRDGRDVRIRRIYNRVVFDEMRKKAPPMGFSFQDELDVTWVPHPNWYYRISKHSLPFLKSRYVPSCTLLSELLELPPDLSGYVLKPLYSFAGSGVVVDVTEEQIQAVQDPSAWVLQEKVRYAPCIPTEDEPSKAEIRLMFLWQEEPLLVTNLVRMSKGQMMGVDFNKNRTWVGSSIAYC